MLIDRNTEAILNLPGKLPFFATPATSSAKIKSLIERLQPVTFGAELLRLGPAADGGYLVPNDLGGIAACFSPGVSDICGFEEDCASRGMKVFMADASVEEPPRAHPSFSFVKKFVGCSTVGEFITLADWVDAAHISSDDDLMLQMDIEGYEYESLLSAPSALLQRFRIIVVEFHYLDHLFSEPLYRIYAGVFEKLLLGHSCVHIHPNNIAGTLKVGDFEIPQMAEFTFLRNDRVRDPKFVTTFPNVLDHDNFPQHAVVLPRSCFRAG
ncbi:MAG: FkbM family methyltransferase [Bryobacteraceae bacterium]